MYHSGVSPLRGVRRGGSEAVETVRGLRQRRLHKAFLRYRAGKAPPRAELAAGGDGGRRRRGTAHRQEARGAEVHDEGGVSGEEVTRRYVFMEVCAFA